MHKLLCDHHIVIDTAASDKDALLWANQSEKNLLHLSNHNLHTSFVQSSVQTNGFEVGRLRSILSFQKKNNNDHLSIIWRITGGEELLDGLHHLMSNNHPISPKENGRESIRTKGLILRHSTKGFIDLIHQHQPG